MVESKFGWLSKERFYSQVSASLRKELSCYMKFLKKQGPLREPDETSAVTADASSVVERMKNLDLAELDESAAQKLSEAKTRFEKARIDATRAFANEALNHF